ncbi:DinI-like family protein, partial [Escherichia coli]|nr:DinI-like family protein [Escherichia coli]
YSHMVTLWGNYEGISQGHVSVRYAAANNLSVIGATKEDKQRISEILQETWESADDWFVSE